MSKWITDREPTSDDAPMNYIIIWEDRWQIPVVVDYGDWHKRHPWMPIDKPEPYVKPMRWTAKWNEHLGVWTLRNTVYNEQELGIVYLEYLRAEDEHREAAERIAAIYEETMP